MRMTLIAALFLSALAASTPAAAGESQEVLRAAGKGALRGAQACAVPLGVAASSGAGSAGLSVGAAIALICLPFGIALGAIAEVANLPHVRGNPAMTALYDLPRKFHITRAK